MKNLLTPRYHSQTWSALLATAVIVFLPICAQATYKNQAQTTKDAIVRSCPNRLCPVVQTMPKGTKFTWELSKSGFVNITNTTFWVAISDIN